MRTLEEVSTFELNEPIRFIEECCTIKLDEPINFIREGNSYLIEWVNNNYNIYKDYQTEQANKVT